jgi:hypothetical protein
MNQQLGYVGRNGREPLLHRRVGDMLDGSIEFGHANREPFCRGLNGFRQGGIHGNGAAEGDRDGVSNGRGGDSEKRTIRITSHAAYFSVYNRYQFL